MHPLLASIFNAEPFLAAVQTLLTYEGLAEDAEFSTDEASKGLSIYREDLLFWLNVDLSAEADCCFDCYIAPVSGVDDDPCLRYFGVQSTDGGESWSLLLGSCNQEKHQVHQPGRWIWELRTGLFGDAHQAPGEPRAAYYSREEGMRIIADMIRAFAQLPKSSPTS